MHQTIWDRAHLQGVTIQNAYSADGRLARSERSDTAIITDIVLDPAGRRLAKHENGLLQATCT